MGSCLLCDLILSHPELFQNQTVVELGAGVGLSSILAACFAQHVIVTDSSHGALQLACHNVLQNSTLLSQQPLQQQHPQQQANHTPLDPMVTQPQSKDRGKHQQQSSVHIKALDWLSLFDTQLSSLSHAEVLELLNSCCDSVACTSAHAATSTQQQSPISSSMLVQHPPTQQHAGQQAAQPQQQIYIWTQEDLHLLASAQIWLAADVVYNEMLTDAFMRTAYQLMTWQQQQAKVAAGAGGLHKKPRLFVAAEKRYNFTYRDLDARASAFEHFMTYIRPVSTDDSTAGQVLPLQMASDRQQSQQDGKAVSSKSQEWTDKPLFMGRRWSLDSLPQVRQTCLDNRGMQQACSAVMHRSSRPTATVAVVELAST